MPNVFIAYAGENRPDVEQLVEHLRLLGCTPWLDSSLHGGQDWWQEILRQVLGCDVFIAVISEGSLRSTACQREFDWAEALNKPVLPVLVERLLSLSALPPRLSQRQMIDYSDRESRDRAAVALGGALATLSAPPLPDPLPESPAAPLTYLTDLADRSAGSRVLDHDQQRDIVAGLEHALRSVDPVERRVGDRILEELSHRDDLSLDVHSAINRMRMREVAAAPPSPAPRPAPSAMPPDSGPVFAGAAYGPPASAGPVGWSQPADVVRPGKPKRDRNRRHDTKNKEKKDGKSQRIEKASKGAEDRLSSSVFAPPEVERGDMFLVQVFAHLPDQAVEAAALAQTYDPDARPRGSFGLNSRVKKGDRLSFELGLPDFDVDDHVQSLDWTGQPEAVQFVVTVPKDFAAKSVFGTVTVSRDTVPMGHVKFKVSVCESETMRGSDAQPERWDMQRYRRAFISYASADRTEVLKRTQMLDSVHIEFFQDLLSLEPGQRWERQLYREIDRCDVFLLFWSSAAKNSPWVIKEVQYAMKRNGGDELAPPEILPVIIEGPPPVDAPPELTHLHFNDRMIYFMEPSPKGRFARLRRRGR